MTTFLRAGVPISKLEENALRLHEPRHMLDLIPFILDNENPRLQQRSKQIFIIDI